MATSTKAKDPLASAKQQGQAQFDSIKEMVDALRAAENGDDQYGAAHDEAIEAITQDALSVQVRSGWYSPGGDTGDREACEYEILLCTGGPACRIIGELDRGSPVSAEIQVQDWFQPWTTMTPKQRDYADVLLEYARCYYFGE